MNTEHLSTSSPTIDVLIGDEEQNRKHKKEKKNRERTSNQATLEDLDKVKCVLHWWETDNLMLK